MKSLVVMVIVMELYNQLPQPLHCHAGKVGKPVSGALVAVATSELASDEGVRGQHHSDRENVHHAVGDHRVGDVDPMIWEELNTRVHNAKPRSGGPGHLLEGYERLETLNGQLWAD